MKTFKYAVQEILLVFIGISIAIQANNWNESRKFKEEQGRFTIDKKYQKKEIYIAFIEDGIIKMYNHEDAVSVITDNIKNSDSWVRYGGYSWGKTPKKYDSFTFASSEKNY